MGQRHGRRVIDAITHHQHMVTATGQGLQMRGFFLGVDGGAPQSDTRVGSDLRSRTGLVARQHFGHDAARFQRGQHLPAFGADLVPEQEPHRRQCTGPKPETGASPIFDATPGGVAKT